MSHRQAAGRRLSFLQSGMGSEMSMVIEIL